MSCGYDVIVVGARRGGSPTAMLLAVAAFYDSDNAARIMREASTAPPS